MKRVTTIVTALAAILFTTALGLAWQTEGAATDEKSLDQLVQDWIAAHNRGDAKALAKFYDRDADFIGIDGRVVKGRDAIVKMYAEVFTRRPGNKARVSLSSRRFIKADVVIDDGIWEVKGVLPKGSPTKGRYTAILRKHDGKWRIVSDRTMVPWAPPTAEGSDETLR